VASQSHAACAWQARWLQDVANMRKKLKKLKSFSFSRVSEGALGAFLRFRCYVLGTKLGSVLLLRMRSQAMQLVLGRLAGCKIAPRWGNIAPKMGQHSSKMGQHSPKMRPYCPQDRPT